jgi:hypothetical protein
MTWYIVTTIVLFGVSVFLWLLLWGRQDWPGGAKCAAGSTSRRYG